MHRTINIAVSVLLPIAGGVVCLGLINSKPAPRLHGSTSRIPEVTVLSVLPRIEQSPVTGHGAVRAKNEIDIVPQVSGKLVHVHPDLAVGKIIPKGALLFQIDPIVYETRVQQAEAEVRGLEAALGRHDQELQSLEQRIANARAMLEIDERDYETSKRLFEVDSVGTKRDVDLVLQKLLRQRDALAELTSRTDMIPHLKLETQSRLDAAQSSLRQARHNLESTRITCPYKARVDSVHARRSQVVTAHFSIARLTDMEAFEVSVGIDPREMRWLDPAVRPGALEGTDDASRPRAVVRWSLRGTHASWNGTVTRFERVDEATRTARMIVEVRDVDMTARIGDGEGESVTLSIGMFCKAELPAARLEDAMLVPRHAIYDNRWVYVFDPDPDAPDASSGRLARREVAMLRTVEDDVLVDYRDRQGDEPCELRAGDRVITSPLLKPVVGMRIRVRNERLATLSAHPRTAPSPDRPAPVRAALTADRPEPMVLRVPAFVSSAAPFPANH